jgi:hypothetical protein
MRFEALMVVNVKTADFSENFPKELISTEDVSNKMHNFGFQGLATTRAETVPSFWDSLQLSSSG